MVKECINLDKSPQNGDCLGACRCCFILGNTLLSMLHSRKLERFQYIICIGWARRCDGSR